MQGGRSRGGELVGDQEGRRRRRIGQSPQSLQRRAVLNTLSIKENESLQQRRSSLFQGGFVNYIYSTSSRPHTFWRPFCAFDGTENKRGERRNKKKKKRKQCCPTCFSMQGRICWASGRTGPAGEARSRNAPKGNETAAADPFEPSTKAIAVTAHPRPCMPPTAVEKMERFSFYVLGPRFTFY